MKTFLKTVFQKVDRFHPNFNENFWRKELEEEKVEAVGSIFREPIFFSCNNFNHPRFGHLQMDFENSASFFISSTGGPRVKNVKNRFWD